MIILYFLIILLITILIEVPIAWLMGVRKREEITSVILVNIITNPLANYCLIANNRFGLIVENNVAVLILELLVVIIEWRLLSYVWPHRSRYFCLAVSLLINLASFLLGFILF